MSRKGDDVPKSGSEGNPGRGSRRALGESCSAGLESSQRELEREDLALRRGNERGGGGRETERFAVVLDHLERHFLVLAACLGTNSFSAHEKLSKCNNKALSDSEKIFVQ